MKYFFREKRDPFEKTANPHVGWKTLTNIVGKAMRLNQEGDEEFDAFPIYAEPVLSPASREYRDLLSPETRASFENWEEKQRKNASRKRKS
jgi:hypothetical protein